MGDSNMALTGGTNELGVYEPDLQLLQNRLRPRVSISVSVLEWEWE